MASNGINLTNQFLVAMPGMLDERFAGSVVYMCEHNDNGALGLVINKPMEMTLQRLFERVELQLDEPQIGSQPVFFGGPVQTERGFVLHEPQQLDEGEEPLFTATMQVPGGLAMTTSKDVLEAIAAGAGPRRVLITLGYAGWGAGQLEDELGRNGWLNVDAPPHVARIIFETPIEQRHEMALRLLGIDPCMLSQEAGHA